MNSFAIKYIKIWNRLFVKFRYFLGFSVFLELALGDYSLDQANSFSQNQCFSK